MMNWYDYDQCIQGLFVNLDFFVARVSQCIAEQVDECGGLAEFESGSSINYSFSNFSFKVVSCSITLDS